MDSRHHFENDLRRLKDCEDTYNIPRENKFNIVKKMRQWESISKEQSKMAPRMRLAYVQITYMKLYRFPEKRCRFVPEISSYTRSCIKKIKGKLDLLSLKASFPRATSLSSA